MTYYSQAWQDECIANILGFKRSGYYLDIGSNDAHQQSNSYFFESELGWTGICVEFDVRHNTSYQNRNCHLVNEDSTTIDYKSLLDGKHFPSRIDYLSLDVDENSTATLKRLPFDSYKFSIITLEHDTYRLGTAARDEQRAILQSHGYTLLFPDILAPLGCGMGPNLSFEDWWVDASVFNMGALTQIAGANMYPDNVAAILKSRPSGYLL